MVKLLDGRRVRLHLFPAFAIVELHPIILAVFYFAGALECLCKQLAQVIIVGSVLEAQITDVAEVFVEFLCDG